MNIIIIIIIIIATTWASLRPQYHYYHYYHCHNLEARLTVYLQHHGHAHCPCAIFSYTAVGAALLECDAVDEEV